MATQQQHSTQYVLQTSQPCTHCLGNATRAQTLHISATSGKGEAFQAARTWVVFRSAFFDREQYAEVSKDRCIFFCSALVRTGHQLWVCSMWHLNSSFNRGYSLLPVTASGTRMLQATASHKIEIIKKKISSYVLLGSRFIQKWDRLKWQLEAKLH